MASSWQFYFFEERELHFYAALQHLQAKAVNPLY